VNWLYDNREEKKDIRSIKPYMEEDDDGDTEYKLKLISPSDDRLDHLATQMTYRIKEGLGDAYYRIGVEDNGKPTGLEKEEML
jgi:GTPase